MGSVAHYSEGVAVGYQGYDQLGIEPLFPFGYGRSYTSFASSELKMEPDASARNIPIQVSFTLTNSSGRAGVEIAQVYSACLRVEENHSNGWEAGPGSS